jgi:hypothetical protein
VTDFFYLNMNYFQYLFIFIIKTKDAFGQILVKDLPTAICEPIVSNKRLNESRDSINDQHTDKCRHSS